MQGNPPSYFIWNGWVPQLFNPAVPYCRTPWFVMWHLLHYTPSLTMYSPHLQRISFCHFLPAANLFILSKHVFASPTLSYFFFILSLSFIFDPFSSLGHWSFCLSPCSLLSSVLPNSSTSLLSLAWPFLSVFFCLSLRFIKEYPKLVVSVCVWPLCPSFSLCLCLFLPYRSSSLSVCQVLLNPCQSGGIHR